MMVNKIKQNNPQVSNYLDEIQRGGNPNEVLSRAIKNGAITKAQFQQAKPLLQRYGSQMGINISQQDLNALESQFNTNTSQQTFGNKTGFRF